MSYQKFKENFNSFFEILYFVFMYGEFDMGFATRKTWKNKPYFDCGRATYDGEHFYLHLGWFYFGAYW
jgi:hypothetical protein